MELNSCENGSLNKEINDDDEIPMKEKSSLYLKSAEINCRVSSEEHIDDNITGKDRLKIWSEPLNVRMLGVWSIVPDRTLGRNWVQDSVLGSSWGRWVSISGTTGPCQPTFHHPSDQCRILAARRGIVPLTIYGLQVSTAACTNLSENASISWAFHPESRSPFNLDCDVRLSSVTLWQFRFPSS